jgi:hypothetical protein
VKVGDIVRQSSAILKMKGREPSKSLGVVIEICETKELPDSHTSWKKFLGRSITVMWETGKISKNFAENSLEVMNK